MTLEDEKNLYLDALASNEFCKFMSVVVFESIMPLRDAHELWTKLQDKYGKSMSFEDDCSPSTSGRDELSTSSTSPKCGKPQTNVMVSSDRFCNLDSELIFDDRGVVLVLVVLVMTRPSSPKTDFVCVLYCVFGFGDFAGSSVWKVSPFQPFAQSPLLIFIFSIFVG